MPTLLGGFGLALLFHLTFLALFHVVSPGPPDESVQLIPSSVEIDLGQKLVTRVAPPAFPCEKRQAPPLYELAPGAICSLDSDGEYHAIVPDFSELERLDYEPLEVDFDRD